MDDIAVVIVSWNAQDDLKTCLSSIYADPKPNSSFSVWVVDNASSDNSADMVRSDFPQVHLIENTENRGFSSANNQAIAASKNSRYLFLLNSDAFLSSPAALDRLVEFGDRHDKLAVAGAHVLNLDGSLQFSCRRFPGLMSGLFRNTLLGRLFPKNQYTTKYLMGDLDHAQEHLVDWVSGCAMLIERSFIEQHGALDERFFMYCEDVDICKRAWTKGYRVWYCPDAIVTHKIGASSDKNAEPMIWEFHRSWALFDKKYHPNAPVLRRAAVNGGLWLRAAIRIWNRRRNIRHMQRSAHSD